MKMQISLDGMIRQTELLQFDDGAIYIGRDDGERVVRFEQVSSLSKTGTKLNNRYFWELAFWDEVSRKERRIQFRPNYTLWNRNFPRFHALLSSVNPDAVKTPFRWGLS